jgi:hypothetical protein
MSFAKDNGYTPRTLAEIISDLRVKINGQFTTNFTEENFVGSNWYKYSYALAQTIQEGEIKTAEIFAKYQEYIATTNETIQRPSVSAPGILDTLEAAGFVASVKPPADADAGKSFICVQVEDAIAGKQAEGLVTITSYANLVSGTDDSITIGATVFTAQVGAATPGSRNLSSGHVKRSNGFKLGNADQRARDGGSSRKSSCRRRQSLLESHCQRHRW